MPLRLARQQLVERCIDLHREKEHAFDDGIVLSWDFDKKALTLIRDILLHVRDHWREETNAQRRNLLNFIVRTSLFLRREFKCLYNADYPSQGTQGEEMNIWRNLDFLVQYKISPDDPRCRQPLPITFADINAILHELIGLLDPVIAEELRLGLRLQNVQSRAAEQGLAPAGHVAEVLQRHERRVRQPYRDPHRLPYLEALANYGREKLRIARILKAIRLARTIDVSTTQGKMAFLRQLQIIGESVTGKNFSNATKRLVNDVDWQLLIRLRNKLSHNEWDIHSELLPAHTTTANLEAMQRDLAPLETSIVRLQGLHDSLLTDDRRRLHQHYNPAWHLRHAAHLQFMNFIRDCYIAGVITRTQLIELRNLLTRDIRSNHLPTLIRPYIAAIFDRAAPTYAATRHLLPQFQLLVRTFRKETTHFHNLDNPDRRAQRRNAARLARHQTAIRRFHNVLAYTQETYNDDFVRHPDSFQALSLINLIRNELRALRRLLLPLPGSRILFDELPEDSTSFGNVVVIDTLLRTMLAVYGAVSPELRRAIQHIRDYCALSHKPLHLELIGFNTPERFVVYNTSARQLLANIHNLIGPVKVFGRLCEFQSNLIIDPTLVEASFMHMARIQKYIVVLSRLAGVRVDLLPKPEELNALRNFVHHGCTLFDTMKIDPLEIMTRYASLIFCRLSPAIDEIALSLPRRPQQASSAVDALLAHGVALRAPAEDVEAEAAPARPRALSR